MEVVLHGERRRPRPAAGRLQLHDRVVRDVVAEHRCATGARDSRAVAARLPSGRAGQLPAARRLQQRDEGAGRREPDARQADHAAPADAHRPSGRGHRGHARTPTARDGKPVFLQMGAHHAREWPSAEHAMEWAYELVNGYKANNARVRDLMGRVRTIDRPGGEPRGLQRLARGRRGQRRRRGRPGGETPRPPTWSIPHEYQRKNCRVNNPDGDDPERGRLHARPTSPADIGLSQFGIDPNRNYGGFWGGPGASAERPGRRAATTPRTTAATARSPSARPRTSATWSPRARSPR